MAPPLISGYFIAATTSLVAANPFHYQSIVQNYGYLPGDYSGDSSGDYSGDYSGDFLNMEENFELQLEENFELQFERNNEYYMGEDYYESYFYDFKDPYGLEIFAALRFDTGAGPIFLSNFALYALFLIGSAVCPEAPHPKIIFRGSEDRTNNHSM